MPERPHDPLPPRCRIDGRDVHYRSLRYPNETECGVGGLYRPARATDEDATCEWCIRAVDGAPAA
jgi:hypothetical protein